jgi:hypothetical protein
MLVNKKTANNDDKFTIDVLRSINSKDCNVFYEVGNIDDDTWEVCNEIDNVDEDIRNVVDDVIDFINDIMGHRQRRHERRQRRHERRQ